MGGLHALRELGADGPRLGVGLVEDDAGKLGLLGHRFLSFGGGFGQEVSGAACAVTGYLTLLCAIIMRMDAVDRRIIALLLEDGRRTFDDIAGRVQMTAPSVKRRVDRLRASGALEGFTAVVDYGAMGWQTEALVELYFRPGTPLGEVAKVLAQHPEVAEAWSVTGEADAIARVRTEDNRDLERLIIALQRNGMVERTSSQVVMSRLVSRPSATG